MFCKRKRGGRGNRKNDLKRFLCRRSSLYLRLWVTLWSNDWLVWEWGGGVNNIYFKAICSNRKIWRSTGDPKDKKTGLIYKLPEHAGLWWWGGGLVQNQSLEKVLIPQHPVQHAFKKRNRSLSTIQSSTHKEHLHKVFPKLQNVVFFGSIVYKEHLCLNTKD